LVYYYTNDDAQLSMATTLRFKVTNISTKDKTKKGIPRYELTKVKHENQVDKNHLF